MKNLIKTSISSIFALIIIFSFTTSSNAQVLERVKALCEQRAVAWTSTVSDKNTSYRGNMSIEDVKELSDKEIKVIGHYDIYTTACGLRRTKFECKMKIILDSLEIQSFCRLGYQLCIWQVPTGDTKWYCYPN